MLDLSLVLLYLELKVSSALMSGGLETKTPRTALVQLYRASMVYVLFLEFCSCVIGNFSPP